MNRSQTNDPERDRNSRDKQADEIERPEDDSYDNEEQSDLGRAQSEGNLGNERTRSRGPQDTGRERDRSRHEGSL